MSSSSASSLVVPAGEQFAHIRTSTVLDGDFHLDGDRVALHHRRAAFMSGRWTQLDEVHGSVVRRVTAPGEHDGAVGDALVTDLAGVVLGIWVGDCAPVVLVGSNGATAEVAAAHVGWRGALGGVLASTVAAMHSDASAVTGYLGPCIHPCCYEFGADDLARFVDRFGTVAASTTSWGTPALDMRAVVRQSLAELGIELVETPGMSECTGCHSDRYFSHRRRGDRGRQVMAVCARVAS